MIRGTIRGAANIASAVSLKCFVSGENLEAPDTAGIRACCRENARECRRRSVREVAGVGRALMPAGANRHFAGLMHTGIHPDASRTALSVCGECQLATGRVVPRHTASGVPWPEFAQWKKGLNMRLFCLLVVLLLPGLLAAAESRPNIVMVFIDDMGWGDFSCFGNTDAKTPNIDRLAAEGLRFSQFYVNSPICSPSRCALTTGQYPQRWKITSFLNNRADNERRGVAQWLDPSAPSLARILKQHGYATGHFGKWHLGGQRDVDDAPPITNYGFDASLTNFEGMGPKLLPLTLKPGDTEPGKIWSDAVRLGGPVTWMQRSQITGGFVDAALPFMKQAAEDNKPFYINLWPDDVHSPFWPPVDKWADGKRGLYLSVLEEMDRQFGKLFDHIGSTPALRDNTLVLICSDNGPEPGAGSAGPFRGAKAQLYEGGIRSPLVVWGPGLIARDSVGKENALSVFAAFDLPPSILGVAGIARPADVTFDGEDLSATLLGREAASHRAPLFWRRPPDRKTAGPMGGVILPDLAVRDGNWKLLCNYDGSEPQLYDLAADPAESSNIAAEHGEVVRTLTAAVVDWNHSMPADNGPALGEVNVPARRGRRPTPN